MEGAVDERELEPVSAVLEPETPARVLEDGTEVDSVQPRLQIDRQGLDHVPNGRRRAGKHLLRGGFSSLAALDDLEMPLLGFYASVGLEPLELPLKAARALLKFPYRFLELRHRSYAAARHGCSSRSHRRSSQARP